MQAKIAEFITRHGITMTAENVAKNPHREEEEPEKGRKPVEYSHWRCTFTRGQGKHAPTLETYFSMGSGLHNADYRLKAAAQAINADATLTDAVKVARIRKLRCRECDAQSGKIEWYARGNVPPKGQHAGVPPTCSDVLDCLASDASMVDNARHFEDFASDLGYDTDSRKAERIYHACMEQANKLRRFLGNVDYDFLLYKVERE